MASGLVVDIKAMRAQAKVVNTQKTAGVRPGEDFGPTAGTAPGVEVWRIEKLQVVPVDKRQHGKFYSGDSYIVLHTRARATKLVWDLYFWLGAATSQDEAAVAAYKTVELDNRLGGAPTQHRETQGHESAEFRAVFSSIQYLKGGVDSALRAASARGGKPEPRLLHCKGAKTVLVSEVEKKAASLNHGDVYVLDAGDVVYQWNGREANRREKAKALEVAISIRDDDRSGRAQLVVIDDVPAGADDRAAADLDDDEKSFWSHLKGQRTEVRAAAQAGSDDAVATPRPSGAPAAISAPKLFRISDARGSLYMAPAGATGAPLARALLDDDDAFLLDASGGESASGGGSAATGAIYVWIGKRASAEERAGAVRVAEKYVRTHRRPASTQISRVASGGEPAAFRAHFVDWAAHGSALVTDLDSFRRAQARTAAAGAQSSEDELAAQMVAPTPRSGGAEGPEASPLPAPPPAGAVSVYRIEQFERVQLPPTEHGLLNGSDCYVVSFCEKAAGVERTTVYYWLGSHASADEKGAAAIQTVHLSDALGGGCAQVRVCQGHETPRFLSLFAPRLVVFAAGGVASGFRKVNFASAESEDSGGGGGAAGAGAKALAPPPAGGALFHVRGTCAQDVHAVQLEGAVASALSSYDCFVVQSPIAAAGASSAGLGMPKWMGAALSNASSTAPTLWVWRGAHANAAERDGALAAAQLVKSATAAGLNPNVLGVNAGSHRGAAAGTARGAIADVAIVPVDEGSEPAAFWAALGGKTDYTRSQPQPDRGAKDPPPSQRGGIFGWMGGVARGLAANSAYNYTPDDARLFHVTDRTGTLKVEEICNFAQDDLDPEDVSILDAGSVLYVWIGAGASARERAHAPKLADKFVERSAATTGRSAQVPIMQIDAGHEPPHFKALFHGWSDEKTAATYDPYEERLRVASARRAQSHAAADMAADAAAAGAKASR